MEDNLINGPAGTVLTKTGPLGHEFDWLPPAEAEGGGGVTDLEGLSDVDLTSPVDGHSLVYDGSVWKNAVPKSVYWDKIIDADPMTSNTQWTVVGGAWTFDVNGLTAPGSAGSLVRLTAGVSTTKMRAIKATFKITGGSKLAFALGKASGGWSANDLQIGIDPGNDVLYWDKSGYGGAQVGWAGAYNQEYEVMVIEKTISALYLLYVDGVLLWSIAPPAPVLLGGIGFYDNGGPGPIKNVSVWEGDDGWVLPS